MAPRNGKCRANGPRLYTSRAEAHTPAPQRLARARCRAAPQLHPRRPTSWRSPPRRASRSARWRTCSARCCSAALKGPRSRPTRRSPAWIRCTKVLRSRKRSRRCGRPSSYSYTIAAPREFYAQGSPRASPASAAPIPRVRYHSSAATRSTSPKLTSTSPSSACRRADELKASTSRSARGRRRARGARRMDRLVGGLAARRSRSRR